MATDKVTVRFNGRQVQATPVEVNQAAERWNEYLLEDGAVLKIKLVLTKALRLDGTYDGEGNPVYVVQSTNVTSVNAPDGLRKKPT